MLKEIAKIYKAFKAEDNRLQEIADKEEDGNPFTICTNGAYWLKENFFKNAIVTGYNHEHNREAEIGEWTCGHDFLLVDSKYIVDFWYRYINGNKCAPLVLNIETQKDLVKRYYGDPNKWEALPN